VTSGGGDVKKVGRDKREKIPIKWAGDITLVSTSDGKEVVSVKESLIFLFAPFPLGIWGADNGVTLFVQGNKKIRNVN